MVICRDEDADACVRDGAAVWLLPFFPSPQRRPRNDDDELLFKRITSPPLPLLSRFFVFKDEEEEEDPICLGKASLVVPHSCLHLGPRPKPMSKNLKI